LNCSSVIPFGTYAFTGFACWYGLAYLPTSPMGFFAGRPNALSILGWTRHDDERPMRRATITTTNFILRARKGGRPLPALAFYGEKVL